MKKILSAMLCVSLILGTAAISSSSGLSASAESLTQSSSASESNKNISLTAKQGETVTLSLYIENSKNVSGLHCSFNLNAKALSFEGCKTVQGNGNYNVPSRTAFCWNTLMPPQGVDCTKSTKAAEFTFTALRDISSGENTVSYSVVEFFDNDLNDLSPDNVRIVASSSSSASGEILGDVNGDETITSDDALEILRYSVGLGSSYKNFDRLGDVDGDGEVTASDAVYVLRSSVGFDDGFGIGSVLK